MNNEKVKSGSALQTVTIALLVVWFVQPTRAGNKTQMAPNGTGKVESSLTYGPNGSAAKEPNPDGVLSTTSLSFPAAGVNPKPGSGFPGTGNVITAPLPGFCPTTNYCTVTTEFATGGYKAVVRSYVTAGVTADNDELELKIPITAAACASYDAASEFVVDLLHPDHGKMSLNGKGTEGTGIWLRALLYTGSNADPTRDDVKLNSILKGELVVAGPFDSTACPFVVPVIGDMSKMYLLIDTVAKSEPYTMVCPDPVSFGCLDGDPQYPAPTLTGGCAADGTALVHYSIAASALPLGVPTVVTATATPDPEDGSVLATDTFTATRNALVFDGFYSPLNYDSGPSPCSYAYKPSQIAKLGSNIPIKFKTLCGGTSFGGGNPPTVKITRCGNSSFSQVGICKFVADEWHGNFDTTQLGVVADTYIIEVTLQNGVKKKIGVKLK